MKKISSCIITLVTLIIIFTLIILIKGIFILIPFIVPELAFTLLVMTFTICACLFCIILYNLTTMGNDILIIDTQSNNNFVLVSVKNLVE